MVLDKQPAILGPRFKATAPKGIWTPGTSQPLRRDYRTQSLDQLQQLPNLYSVPPTPPSPSNNWKPRSADPSPVSQRKEYRPVKFESPRLGRKLVYTQPYSQSLSSVNASSNENLVREVPRAPAEPPYTPYQKVPKTYYPPGGRRPNDSHYSHNEYITERQNIENERQRMANQIGPIEVTLRSEAENGNQHEWYKKMYKKIHKVHDDDDCLTVRYKTRRGPYKTNGYSSEPERSDYGSVRNPVRPSGAGFHITNPGKIENYIPGNSSLASQENIDKLRKQKYHVEPKSDGNLGRALKDQGYESDSTLVFRKKESSQIATMSPDEQRKAYLNLQSGGEAPIQGFRKPAPEKRKDNAYNIEYTPITSTLTKIQVHRKKDPSPISYNTEIICYPIMNVTRPIDLFGSVPTQPQSFIPPSPPQPPNRRSSKQNTALKICTEMQNISANQDKKSQIKHRIRSHSASSLSSSYRSLREERRIHSPSRWIRTEPRKSSPSNIAFGRSISKERTFAEEKKKLEKQLPPCKKTVRATTSILRDPQVKSIKQVKKAVRSSYLDPAPIEKYSFSLSSGKTKELRSLNLSDDKISRKFLKDNEDSVDYLSVEVSNKSNKPGSLERAPRSKVRVENKPSNILKTSSNLSLEHTSSTYSIESNRSKSQKSTHLKTALSETAKIVKPITITSKPQKKRAEKNLIIAKHKSRITGSKGSSALQTSVRSTESESSYATSGNFFQKLLVHNTAHVSPNISQNAVVQERLHLWNTFPRRSTAKKTIPTSIYLTQKQPVKSSKFKELERETLRQSRSLSPSKPKTIVYDFSSKFDSHYQLTDDEEEFGYDYSCAHGARIKSERGPIITLERPKVIHHPISLPQEIRSPSCRRIQSFKSHKRQEIVAGSGRRYHSLDSHFRARSSANSKTPNENDDICIASNKFKDLNKFYSKVERVGELERATSNTNLHPIRKEEELIDFDVWKKVRCYERAKKELNELLGKLKRDEKEKEFLFRPKYVEDIKWNLNRDRGLRAREKSVEDLKEIFAEKALVNELSNLRQKISNYDIYKPLWRANSVLDLASSMVVKHSPQSPFMKRARSLKEITFLSKNLLSTLSKDQIQKIKSQLTEIYSTNRNPANGIPDEYIINVTKKYDAQPSSLFVRRNSSLSEEDLSKSVYIERFKDDKKISAISHEARVSRSADRYDSVIKREQKIYTEEEKKQLLQQLGNEIKDKIKERREKILQPRETRGAIAAENPITKKAPEQPSSSYLLNYKEKTRAHQTSLDAGKARSIEPTGSQDTILSESSAELREQKINISKGDLNEKIEYFENKRDEEFEKTIYHAREDSSPDEEEIMKVINEKMKAKTEVERHSSQAKLSSSGLSTSACDLKEIFGEKDAPRNLIDFSEQENGNSSLKNASSIESLYRSRSISPIQNSAHSTLKRKTKDETDISTSRQFQSDPDISQVERNVDPFRLGTGSNTGDVSRITHKFETHNVAPRGRSRYRKSVSPIQKIPIKKDDRYMPHIDIISKTASLKHQIERKLPKHHSEHPLHGEVEKIKSKFESLTSDKVSLIGKMFTSTPNIAELNNITEYLTGSWIAHKYPRPNDNARSSQSPDRIVSDDQIIKKKSTSRSSSASPPRSQSVSTFLKQFYDIFSEEDYYDLKNLPTLEGPIGKELQAEFLWRRLKRTNGYSCKPSVQFKGYFQNLFH